MTDSPSTEVSQNRECAWMGSWSFTWPAINWVTNILWHIFKHFVKTAVLTCKSWYTTETLRLLWASFSLQSLNRQSRKAQRQSKYTVKILHTEHGTNNVSLRDWWEGCMRMAWGRVTSNPYPVPSLLVPLKPFWFDAYSFESFPPVLSLMLCEATGE